MCDSRKIIIRCHEMKFEIFSFSSCGEDKILQDWECNRNIPNKNNRVQMVIVNGYLINRDEHDGPR